MASLAATRYSQALFELGVDEKKLDIFKSNLVDIDRVIVENKDLAKVLKHPKVDKDERKRLLDEIFKGIDPLVMNFLKLLVDRNRFQSIHDIKRYFTRLYNEYNGIEVAYIYSATKLSNEDLDAIVKMLETKRQKKIEYETRIDASLIAGIRIKVADEVLDNTIENQLNRMKDKVAKKVL
ncbi:F0F1 ATP synthase subunit delta [Breznakia pachnodae]|uniref:ATP synthase subunit delta n=1 Tax=Breznakia pachnodae TaxID=265178 RepID=A0ABU0E1I3_9FIRM|nr:F0F1 ATP synthase subunit delta [Breznakia pachnodae]MDQ0360593.1 F-type H+-transporting ATPase subunit delta [Breznakia pachnodae]